MSGSGKKRKREQKVEKEVDEQPEPKKQAVGPDVPQPKPKQRAVPEGGKAVSVLWQLRGCPSSLTPNRHIFTKEEMASSATFVNALIEKSLIEQNVPFLP